MMTMLVAHHIDASLLASLTHGGDLAAARQMFPDAPEPFIDLSTGINPFPYPVPTLSADDFARLPDGARVRRLAATAARWYGAPSIDCVVPAPGVQVLLPLVATLVPPGRAAVLGPTYREHARAAALAGHSATEVSSIAQLARADLAVVVNPNNPDGRIIDRKTLLELAAELRRRSGLLVMDEAFADVAGAQITLAGDVDQGNIVVLRSFGKFFGLAGLRLGFALTSVPLANRISAVLGPWAVNGPAITIAEQALNDNIWSDQTLRLLDRASRRLDQMLGRSGLELVGGTLLFRLTRLQDPSRLFNQLGRLGILVRHFDEHRTWLRWGIPPDEPAWQRLEATLKLQHQGV